MAFSSMAMTGASAASSAVGSYWSARTSKIQANAQAAMAEVNARIAERGAQSALAQGQQQIGQLTLKAGQLKSSQRAAMAANGVDLGVGNAAETVASTDIMKEIDVNTIEANAVRSAWGYRTQATNFENEAMALRTTAKAISPGMAGFNSLLGGASSVATNWYTLNKAGAFNTKAG